MTDSNPGFGRSNSQSVARRRTGTFIVASALVLFTTIGAYIALDLAGHRIGFEDGMVQISAK